MLTVYNSIGKISYTVDFPYPEGLETVYDTLADADPEFNHVKTDILANDDIRTLYVNVDAETPTVTIRPVMEDLEYEVVGDQILITGLPTDAVVIVDSTFTGFPDSAEHTFTIDSEDPGVYLVEVSRWPYMEESFEVTVP